MYNWQMFTSIGKIIYDPYRDGMKNRTHWWAVVNVDTEITRYYRWWVMNRYLLKLHSPSWDAHISVIRGEKPPPHLTHLWKKYHNQSIEFKYSHIVRQSGDYWFVEVDSPHLIEIRKEFELPSSWKLHLTVGRTW